MKILVVGGTAGPGLAIARLAAARRHEVTVLARDPGKGGGLLVGTRFVVGDVLDADDAGRAVAGQDAVVWAIGAPNRHSPLDTLSRGTRVLVEAMTRLAVGRLVALVREPRAVARGPLAAWAGRLAGAARDRAIDEDRERQHALIESAGLEATLVRVPAGGGRRGRATTDGSASLRPNPVTADAIAAFVLGQLERPSAEASGARPAAG
ncbi:MAG: NAD(P)H-binding protein [Burkholderiales bacterium]